MGRLTFVGATVLALLGPGMARADITLVGTPQIVSQMGDVSVSPGSIRQTGSFFSGSFNSVTISRSISADSTNMGFGSAESSVFFTQGFRITNAPGGETVNFNPFAFETFNTDEPPAQNNARVVVQGSIDQDVGSLFDGLDDSRFRTGLSFGPTRLLAEGDYTLRERLSGSANIGRAIGDPRNPFILRGTHADFTLRLDLNLFGGHLVPEPSSFVLLGLGLGTVLVAVRRAGARRLGSPIRE